MKAVCLDRYGGPEVLEVREVADPTAGPGEVLVEVRAAGLNPGEISVREGLVHERWPADFPSGQGSDFAGVVRAAGEDVDGFAAGDEVLGWTEERASQAELVVAPTEQVTRKPPELAWEAAGALFVAGMAALACVRAVEPREGETVVVSAAAGGVGSLAAQLVRREGARTIGLASEDNHEWLRAHGIVPVTYGEGQEERVRAAAEGPVDALIDTHGGGYVDLAIELGVAAERINTIIDREAAERHGAQTVGTHAIATAELLALLAQLAAAGELDVEIAAAYPLERVRDAYRLLAERHTRGKLVLLP